jgi:hypothetical protein
MHGSPSQPLDFALAPRGEPNVLANAGDLSQRYLCMIARTKTQPDLHRPCGYRSNGWKQVPPNENNHSSITAAAASCSPPRLRARDSRRLSRFPNPNQAPPECLPQESADRGASPTRGARWSIHAGRPARHAHAPCSSRPSHGGLAQRRSQEGQGQGGTHRPRGRWGRATLPTEKPPPRPWQAGGVGPSDRRSLRRKNGGWEVSMASWCTSSRGAAAGFRGELLPATSSTTSWSCHRR